MADRVYQSATAECTYLSRFVHCFVDERNGADAYFLLSLTQAWLVCPDSAGNADVYVNLGAYDYMTPAGCADETIHAYTGATATP